MFANSTTEEVWCGSIHKNHLASVWFSVGLVILEFHCKNQRDIYKLYIVALHVMYGVIVKLKYLKHVY